ncbi:MAG: hypothetical protein ACO1SV_21555 [Fimbriimonas sp.]
MAVLSQEARRELIRAALNAGKSDKRYRSVRETFDDHVVWEEWGDDMEGVTATFRSDYSILDGKVTLGEAKRVQAVTVYEPVVPASFSMGGSVVFDGDYVVRTGPIFKLGSYPDKAFSLNADEADANIATFMPVPVDVEHDRSVFKKNPKGEFGSLEKVWRQGEEIIGRVKLPKPFHELLEPGDLPVSCHFNPATKQLERLALTGNPRITSAKLSAMFSAAESRRSGSAMEQDDKDFLAKLKALFSGGAPNPTHQPPAPQPGGDAEVQRLRTENETLRGQVNTLTAQVGTFSNAQVTTAAAAFADSLKDRILPASRQDAIDSYADALRMDNSGGVLFSDDGKPKEGTATQRVRRMYEALRPHGLTEDRIPNPQEQQRQPGQGAQFNADDAVDMDAVKGALGRNA